MNGIKLIDIKADEGISGSTLERPGLQAALQMLKRGRANTLLVAKLDRLSRSLRDVCALVEDFPCDDRYHLLSLCGILPRDGGLWHPAQVRGLLVGDDESAGVGG